MLRLILSFILITAFLAGAGCRSQQPPGDEAPTGSLAIDVQKAKVLGHLIVDIAYEDAAKREKAHKLIDTAGNIADVLAVIHGGTVTIDQARRAAHSMIEMAGGSQARKDRLHSLVDRAVDVAAVFGVIDVPATQPTTRP